MRRLYGISHHSPVVVYDKLVNFTKKNLGKKIDILNITGKSNLPNDFIQKNYEAEILLIPAFDDFLKVYKELNNLDIVVILFGVPHLLDELDKLEFIDVVNGNQSFTFMLKSIDWVSFKHSITKSFKKESKPVKISRNRVDIIPMIIKTLHSSNFLDPYNYIRYQILNQKTRIPYTKTVIDFVFGLTTYTDFESQLREILPKKGKSIEYLNNLLDYIKSEDGKNLLKACSKVLDYISEGKSPNYKEIEKELNVNLYSLKYLTSNYRDIYKKEILKGYPKKLEDIQKHYTSDHKYKDVAATRNFG